MAEQPQRHLRITTGAMPRYCLLPGDPARAERIAARFDEHEETIRNREFLGFRGMVGGVPLGVCSTGIGGPSASIALEELANVGVDTFIRVGSASRAAGGNPHRQPRRGHRRIWGEGTSPICLPNPMTRPVSRARAGFEPPRTPVPHLIVRAD